MPGKTRQAAFADRATLLLLQDDASLYSLSLSGGERVRIASGVSLFALSEDGSRLAIADKEGVTVLGGPNGSSYRFLHIENAKAISSLSWYKDTAHLFLANDSGLFFLDLADAAAGQTTPVAASTDFTYLPDTNDLYYIKDERLMRMEFPE